MNIFNALSRKGAKKNEQKKMIINVVHQDESRVAITDNGVLQDLSMETTSREKLRGNIYKGRVQRVEPSLYAAFVEYGGNRPGFLPLDDVMPQYRHESVRESKGKLPPGKVLHKNQEILVQVTKDEKDNKGAALTTYVSLPGRYLVLMPGYKRTGISRKIEDRDERKKLKDIGRELKVPEDVGFIIRTAGLNKGKKELQADANYLVRLWKAVQSRADELPPGSLVYQESSMVIQAIRDYYTTDISEVLVDNAEVCQKVREFFKQVIPKHQKIVKLYEDNEPIFQKHAIEEQIEPLYDRVVPLKSGGRLCIDPTEALVSIDVNSGRFTRVKDPEESATITNVEAAEEVARQLRLRDLGGLIVIDFIDMRQAKNRQQVERQLRASFKSDKANIEISSISKFGLLEMSREHLRSPLSDYSHRECLHCSGTGRVRSRENIVRAALRDILSRVSGGGIATLSLRLAPEIAEYMHNSLRREISDIEKQFALRISISSDSAVSMNAYTIEQTDVPKQTPERKTKRS